MKGYDDTSTKLLEETAKRMGLTDDYRKMLQQVYDLGRRDGQLEQLKGQIANKEAGA